MAHNMTSNDPGLIDIEALSYRELADFLGVDRDFVWSIPFDGNRVSDGPRLNTKAESIIRELDSRRTARRRTADEARRFKACASSLTANLLAAWRISPNLQIGFPRGRDAYGTRSPLSRYRNPDLSYNLMIKQAFAGFLELAYVQIDREGYFDQESGTGRLTKIRGTEKLIGLLHQDGPLWPWELCHRPDAEVLVLKDEKKNRIDFTDNDATRLIRDNLRLINNALLAHWPDLELADDQLSRLGKAMVADDDRQPLDLSRRTLYRVFNNRSFEQGGRFYGGWWQHVPRVYRPFIRINGERTTELDYSSLHPRILYALAGLQMIGDPYDIGLDPRHRDRVKETFNALVNASGKIEEPDIYQHEGLPLTFPELQERIKERHKAIAHMFNSGFGLKGQSLDSSIAEKVLLHFAGRGICCLPIHDSFVVPRNCEAELQDVMLRAYREVMDQDGEVKAEREVPLGLDELSYESDRAKGFKDRLNAWFAWKEQSLPS
jgi:hypothetical protein